MQLVRLSAEDGKLLQSLGIVPELIWTLPVVTDEEQQRDQKFGVRVFRWKTMTDLQRFMQMARDGDMSCFE